MPPPDAAAEAEANDGVDDDDEYGQEGDDDVEFPDNDQYEADQLMAVPGLDPPAAEDEEIGLAVLDSACQKTMHGRAWRLSMEHELAKLGLSPVNRASRQSFRGIGGSTKSVRLVTFPVGVRGGRRVGVGRD